MTLPDLKGCGEWQVVVDTSMEESLKKRKLAGNELKMGARSAVVAVARC